MNEGLRAVLQGFGHRFLSRQPSSGLNYDVSASAMTMAIGMEMVTGMGGGGDGDGW